MDTRLKEKTPRAGWEEKCLRAAKSFFCSFPPARLLLNSSPLGGAVAAVPIFCLSRVALLLRVQQLAPGTAGTDAFLGKVGANQRVLLLALRGKKRAKLGKAA